MVSSGTIFHHFPRGGLNTDQLNPAPNFAGHNLYIRTVHMGEGSRQILAGRDHGWTMGSPARAANKWRKSPAERSAAVKLWPRLPANIAGCRLRHHPGKIGFWNCSIIARVGDRIWNDQLGFEIAHVYRSRTVSKHCFFARRRKSRHWQERGSWPPEFHR